MFCKVTIGVAALSLLGCSGATEGRSELCAASEGWIPVDDFVLEEGYYISAFVRESDIKIQNSVSIKHHQFASYLQMQSELQVDQNIYPYLILTSESDLDCSTFANVAEIVDDHFECSTSDQCIWAFGDGRGALPSGVPTPTGPRKVLSD